MNNIKIKVYKKFLKKFVKNTMEQKTLLMTGLKICSHDKLSAGEEIDFLVRFLQFMFSC